MKILILSILAFTWLALAFFYSKRSGICVALILLGCFMGGHISEQIAPGRWGFPRAFQVLLPMGAGIGLLTGVWLTRSLPPAPRARLRHGLITGTLFLALMLIVYKYPTKLADYAAVNGMYRTAGLLAYSGILPHEEVENTMLIWAPNSLKNWILTGMLTGRDHPVEEQNYWSRWKLLRRLHENGQDDLLQRAIIFLTNESREGREDLLNNIIYADKDNGNPFARTLFQQGLSPDITNAEGQPILLSACRAQHWALADNILTSGAKPDLSDPEGFSALSWAVIHGNLEFARKLITAGADPHALVHAAPQTGYPAREYHQQGAGLLHLAAISGAPECVPFLLQSGLDPKSTDAQGLQPVFFAAYKGGAPVIRLLAVGGVNANAADKQGLSPLHLAMTWGEERELPVSISDRDTFFKSTIMDKQAQVISLLLAAGVDAHITDQQGRSLMHYAAADGVDDIECMEALLEAGADPEKKDPTGRTPTSILEARILADGVYSRRIPLESSSEKGWRRDAEKKKENKILEMFSQKRLSTSIP